MKYAFCNEMFGQQPPAEVWPQLRDLGYTGVEIAPFTLDADATPFDVAKISAERRNQVVGQAAAADLEVVGLHWLLAKTEGLYLTSPDAEVRQRTTAYLQELAKLCRDVGGKILVLGSPQQRNLLPGVGYDEAEDYAAEVLRGAMPTYEQCEVTLALEPLGPAEGDFLLTAAQAVELAEKVNSPCCKLHLDAKAMSTESAPPAALIRHYKDWMVHFHANDPNRLGPGMGDLEFGPIYDALKQIQYDGWISVEAFRYEPTPMEVARKSIEYLQRIEG